MTNNLSASASSSSSSSTTANRHVKPPSSIREIVDRHCIKPVPPPTGPGVIPRLRVVSCAFCKQPAGMDGPSSVVICDVCEEVFHHSCAKSIRGRYAARIQEWMCGTCYEVRLQTTLRQAANASGGEAEDSRNVYTSRK